MNYHIQPLLSGGNSTTLKEDEEPSDGVKPIGLGVQHMELIMRYMREKPLTTYSTTNETKPEPYHFLDE